MRNSLRAAETTTINRSLEAVFEYVSDLETMDHWVTGVSDPRLASGERGEAGAVYEFGYEHRGKTVPMVVEITTLEPAERIATRSVSGPFSYESEVRFSRIDHGVTRVENVIEPGADGLFTAVVFTAFTPILRRLMQRRLRAELSTLKAILEAIDPDEEPQADRLAPAAH